MKPVCLDSFSNKEIIKWLLDYGDRLDEGPVSSHWRKWAKESYMKVERGAITEAQGVGFGDCQLQSSQVLLHYLTIISYLLFVRRRLNVLSWMHRAQEIMTACRVFDLFFSYDVFRQCCVGALLQTYIDERKHPEILMIGDGYGILAGLIKLRYPRCKLYLIDIMPALAFQAIVLGAWLKEAEFSLMISGERRQCFLPSRGADVTFCHAGALGKLRGKGYDLAINVAGMQEMNKISIRRYFTFLRRHLKPDGLFYCCNREEKILTGGEVVRFSEYPWLDGDIHLIDEEPPFYRWFFGKAKAANSLYMGKIRVPFGRRFDGRMRHRLTRLEQQ